MKQTSKLSNWILASRPKTLWAAIAPVLIGTALAFEEDKGHWPSAVLAGIGAILIQIGTNFANDYFDFFKGADSGERLGPIRATQSGLIAPRSMKLAFVTVFSLTVVVGIYLIVRAGWPIVMIGALSILSGILYTAGPLSLAYLGLGDIFVFLFFGLAAVGGTYFVQALTINEMVILAGVSPGLFSTAILTVNNLRDIVSDRAAGKKTLAVRFGAKFARAEYFFCITIACLMPIILVWLTGQHHLSLLSCLTLFIAIPTMRTIFVEKPGRIFNQMLAQTGKLLFLFSILFSLGWIL